MGHSLQKEDILGGLRSLGLMPGDAVEVHSSLSSLGDVEGGADTVIDALMETVGEAGAIIMSAYLVSPPLWPTEEERTMGIICKVRLLDENSDVRTGMGIIPDTFMKRPSTVLGQGIHRVCAWGRDADLHSQGYQYLLSIDGWVLLIGVGINRCSCLHIADDLVTVPKEISEYNQTPAAILEKYTESDWWVEYVNPDKAPLADSWGKVLAEAERRGLVKYGQIGQAGCMLFKGKAMVDILVDCLRDDPYGLMGITKE